MAWTVEISKFAREDIAKLDKGAVTLILKYLAKNINGCEDPTQFGKPLSGDLVGLHRYRVGDFRVVCILEHGRLTVIAIGISHRKDIYQKIRLTYRKLIKPE